MLPLARGKAKKKKPETLQPCPLPSNVPVRGQAFAGADYAAFGQHLGRALQKLPTKPDWPGVLQGMSTGFGARRSRRCFEGTKVDPREFQDAVPEDLGAEAPQFSRASRRV